MTPKAFFKMLFDFFFTVILIGLAVLAYTLLLTGCVKRDPFPVDNTITDWPVPGDPDIITVADVQFELPEPTPTPVCNYGLQSWVRYPVNPNTIQEVGIAVDYCNAPIEGQLVTVCVAAVCHKEVTGVDGLVDSAKFERTWQIGSVPITVCLDNLPVCLQYSFTAEEPQP